MKVVINKCFGGFGLSEAAIQAYARKKGLTLYPEKDRFNLTTYFTVPKSDRVVELPGGWNSHSFEQRAAYNKAYREQVLYDRDIPRDDKDLVSVVEELGDKCNTQYSKLSVVNVPDGVAWEISDCGGLEHVAEKHRTWE